MINALIIAFRESLEILIVITALLVYLNKIDKRSLSKYMYLGSFLGLLLSILIGVTLYTQLSHLEGFAKQFFEGGMCLFVAGLILFNIIWLGNQNKAKHLAIEEKYNIKSTKISLFTLTFLTVFRESLEIVMFLLPVMLLKPFEVIIGVLIGVFSAIVIMYIIYKTTSKFNPSIIFSLLNLVLIAIGALMFGEGLAAFFPSDGPSMELAGKLLFGLPLLYIFSKSEIKKYIRKSDQ